MSWLFDRLCELAVADRVDVVVHAAVPAQTDDETVRLAELLVRAARARQFSMSILHPGPARGPEEGDIVVDLELLGDDDAEDAAAALVPPASGGGWFVRVEQGVLVVHEAAITSIAPVADPSRRDTAVRRCVITDRADTEQSLAFLRSSDLGIAVSKVPLPGVHVVDNAADLLVMLDALVVLRHVAFGTDVRPEPDGGELLQRPRLRALLAT